MSAKDQLQNLLNKLPVRMKTTAIGSSSFLELSENGNIWNIWNGHSKPSFSGSFNEVESKLSQLINK